MELRALGRTGLEVSRLGLGTMTWGRGTDEHEARDQFTTFLDAGGTLVDTAAGYGDGAAETLLGTFVADILGRTGRDEVVIATKAGISRRGGSRRLDTSRGSLLRTLDASLERLGVDHVDLWQVHVWHDTTPLEETLSALDLAISTGRAAYVGVSNYTGWQTARAATLAELGSGFGLASTQVEYSLLSREVEFEILPAAGAMGMGVMAWSPLASGALTGKYRTGIPSDSRGATNEWGPRVESYLDDRGRGIVEAVVRAAEGLDWTPAQVALAWLRDRPGVTAPILGARTAAQLRSLLEVERFTLPVELAHALDDVSAP